MKWFLIEGLTGAYWIFWLGYTLYQLGWKTGRNWNALWFQCQSTVNLYSSSCYFFWQCMPLQPQSRRMQPNFEMYKQCNTSYQSRHLFILIWKWSIFIFFILYVFVVSDALSPCITCWRLIVNLSWISLIVLCTQAELTWYTLFCRINSREWNQIYIYKILLASGA